MQSKRLIIRKEDGSSWNARSNSWVIYLSPTEYGSYDDLPYKVGFISIYKIVVVGENYQYLCGEGGFATVVDLNAKVSQKAGAEQSVTESTRLSETRYRRTVLEGIKSLCSTDLLDYPALRGRSSYSLAVDEE